MLIVGVGASAGGLEALKELVAHLPQSDALCYVVAQHLSPTHNSLLMELLAPETRLPVQSLEDGQRPEPGAIYITPPNYDVQYAQGALRLTTPQPGVGPKPSVNRLFTSLAENLGEDSIGVILSGTGSDGAAGIRAIKAAGGVTVVQDPGTAKYDGMPRAALQTGSVDLVLAPGRIGEALEMVASSPVGRRALPVAAEGLDAYQRILSTCRELTSFDLGHYKPSTVHRRIQRRIGITGRDSLEHYAEFLKQDKQEANHLVKDILISVTSFFRDHEAFEALRDVIGRLVRDSASQDVIRCWVPGCATGEEAYSIAMIFAETVRNREDAPEFLLFATDTDVDALTCARNGVYPEAVLEQVPELLRQRYFETSRGFSHVVKSLRQKVVFSNQNVIEDPPFSRMSLISCRNLLIYLTKPVQKRVLEIFHYALAPSAYLFLGQSESIELHKDLFDTVDKSARIFRRRDNVAAYSLPMRLSVTGQEPDIRRGDCLPRGGVRAREQRIGAALAEVYAPPAVIVDETDQVVQFFGDLHDYLRFPRGSAGLLIHEMLEPQMRAEVRALLHRCRRQRQTIRGASFAICRDHQDFTVRPTVHYLLVDEQPLLAVAFERNGRPPATEGTAPAGEPGSELIVAELERELAQTRENLQTVVEELDTSNEELQALNEELQSSNEELQSTNEELLTVNDELQNKSGELEILAGDLDNIKESLDFPLVVVDERLRITHTNRAAERIMVLDGLQDGVSLNLVQWRLVHLRLGRQIRDVIRSGSPRQSQVRGDDAKHYLMRIMPFRKTDGAVGGAVFTFTDISVQKRAERTLREREVLYRVTFELSGVGIALVGADRRFMKVNRVLRETLGYEEKELLSVRFLELLHPEDRPALEAFLDQARSDGRDGWEAEQRYRHRDGHWLWGLLHVAAVRDGDGALLHYIAHILDITERKQHQQRLQEEHARLALLNAVSGRVAEEAPVEEVIGLTLERLHGLFPALRVSYCTIDPDNRLTVAYTRQPPGLPGLDGLTADLSAVPLYLEALRKQQAVIVPDVAKDPRVAPLAEALEAGSARAILDVPVVYLDQVVSIIALDAPEPRQWSDFETGTLRELGDILAVAIHHARAVAARQLAMRALFDEKERVQITLASIGDGVITVDTGARITYMNPMAERLTGWTDREAGDLPLEQVFRVVRADSRQPIDDPTQRCLEEGRVIDDNDYEALLLARDGRELAVNHSAAPIRDHGGRLIGAVLVFHDVTEQHTLARELAFRASHDPLTGLANRAEFEHRVQHAYERAAQDGERHAVCFLDLDQFKVVNDTCGHAAGDELLKQVALLLRERLRKSDLLARLGGDEFGVLLEYCPLHKAEAIARQLLEAVRSLRFSWQNKSFTLGVSIGLVELDPELGTLSTLLSRADAACYAAKEAGRNRVYVSRSEDDEVARHQDQMHLSAAIGKALEEDRLFLQAQDIYDLCADPPRAVFRELLVRLRDEAGRDLLPGVFIPAAERYLLMPAIDRWVVGRALESMKNEVDGPLTMINLSGQTLGDRAFLEFASTALQDSGVDPRRLCFEITETAAVSYLSEAIGFIKALRKLGCRFALDDFGAGMSSFAYLKSLPVEFLKIDGGFVSHLADSRSDRAIVEAIHRVAQVLGLKTIAEYVERQETLDSVRAIGLDYAQGWLLARPALFGPEPEPRPDQSLA